MSTFRLLLLNREAHHKQLPGYYIVYYDVEHLHYKLHHSWSIRSSLSIHRLVSVII